MFRVCSAEKLWSGAHLILFAEIYNAAGLV